MSKKKHEPASLGEVVSGTTVSVEGLERLASQHHSVRYVLDVLKQLQARPYATCALIRGEPGTGKEGLALTLHELMQGQDAPLVTISTAGRPEDDVAAELFGTAPHKKGDRPTDGAVADADGGTLVLDEIIGLSAGLQRRLLDLVRDGSYQREGESRERHVQLQVFAISDGDVAAEVRAGRLRHDLYYKLARLDLVLPPLRERPEDIPAAVRWMARRVLLRRDRPAQVALEAEGAAPPEGTNLLVSREAIDVLGRHAWPGNFRELECVIERAVLLYSDGTRLAARDVERALVWP
jgi:two-component system response regulator AtoC